MTDQSPTGPQLWPADVESDGFKVLGAAVGDAESRFMSTVAIELAQDVTVAHAYLLVASINGAPSEVVLALRFYPKMENEQTISRCAAVFSRMFNLAQSLAILPLDEKQEASLAGILPFYSHGLNR